MLNIQNLTVRRGDKDVLKDVSLSVGTRELVALVGANGVGKSTFAMALLGHPSCQILSGSMMFEYLGWTEVSKLIQVGLEKAVLAKTVTYDFARLMDGAKEVKCSEFADEMIRHMG